MGIMSAIGGKERSRAERFEEQASAQLTKEETRALEMALLKPEPMVEPACPPPTTRGVIDTKVAFYIPPKRYWRIFQKFFKVSRMGERSNANGIARGENSVRDIRIFLALLDGLITGKLVFNAETNTIEAGLSPRQRQLLEEFEVVARQHIEAEDMDAPGTTISLVDEVYVMLEKVFGYSGPARKGQ